MTTLNLTIDWPALHAACRALDMARRAGHGRDIGHVALYDAFGGSYFGPRYEREGVAGVAAIDRALRAITDDAWDIIHRGSRDIAAAAKERIEDGRVIELQYEYADSLAERPVRDGEGNYIYRRRYSFRRRRLMAAQRKEAAAARVEMARRTMSAARPVYDLLHAIGIETADPAQCITAGTYITDAAQQARV